jgi:catechol 2,3-dioxygenase-like lactoylglutathione lyase family enzyme
MSVRLALVTYLVLDYDEAIDWLRDALGFVRGEDIDINGESWLTMAPPSRGEHLRLVKAVGPAQLARVGDQLGGRMSLRLHTDDITGARTRMEARGVVFEEPIRRESYGQVCVFRDLYGNRWDLIEKTTH